MQIISVSASNGSVNSFRICTIKSISLFTWDFAADSSRCSEIISNYLLQDRVAINIRWKLQHWAYEQ